jgi:hypothetical protein
MTEDIGKAIVALMEGKGARTIHGAIGILMTAMMVLMKRLPASKDKEQMRKAMVWALGQC